MELWILRLSEITMGTPMTFVMAKHFQAIQYERWQEDQGAPAKVPEMANIALFASVKRLGAGEH